jgi:hypothetical protein
MRDFRTICVCYFKIIFFPPMALQPLLGPGRFFSSVIIFYTDGRTPWTSEKPVARPLSTHSTTETQNKRIYRHPCLAWYSNPRSQLSSERRQFMRPTARPLWWAFQRHSTKEIDKSEEYINDSHIMVSLKLETYRRIGCSTYRKLRQIEFQSILWNTAFGRSGTRRRKKIWKYRLHLEVS